jgi:hypothetical protein
MANVMRNFAGMKIHVLLFALALLVAACNVGEQQKTLPKLESFTSKEIGWTIAIPAGFQLLSKSRVTANEEKGRAALGGKDQQTTETSSLQHLVNFQKNQFNLFYTTIEPFEAKNKGAYTANVQLVKKMVFDAYNNQHIKIDTASGKEIFGKQSFHAFYIKIYGPNGQLLMNQHLYSALIKGYEFSVNINYNNEDDHRILIDHFKSSSFVP